MCRLYCTEMRYRRAVMRRQRRAAWLCAMVAATTSLIAGQHEDHPVPPAAFSGGIDLYKTALGPFTRPISSQNREAQAFFNQGFQLTYAFAKPEAVRSFREAQTRDPLCAICFWGEAWAWGSDLNWPMGAEEAYDYLLHHIRLAGGKPDNVFDATALEVLARGTFGLPDALPANVFAETKTGEAPNGDILTELGDLMFDEFRDRRLAGLVLDERLFQ